MAINGGWAGKTLRVNLSTGNITTINTENFKRYIGGMGIGYKVLWDEVPAGTKAFDEANKIVFGVGPLTGTGAICSGRTNITSLLPSNPYNAVSDSHMGGHFGVELKYAGWDAIIVEGKSSRPVWLKIVNDKVTIEDAGLFWGKGTFDTIAGITAMMGQESQVAAIGQAGENLVNLSVIRTGPSHSAGGHGGVLGSKMLKAIGIMGSGAVKIAGDKMKWHELNQYTLSIVGANNQHVVPRTPQPWAEYNHPGSRWTAKEGLYWEKADPPIETGICTPEENHKIGFRTMKSMLDIGKNGPKYTVRMGGCASCPIRCKSHLEVPQLERYGVPTHVANTCMGFYTPWGVIAPFSGNKANVPGESEDDSLVIAKALGTYIADDYGVWGNYGQIGRDFHWTYKNDVLKRVLPAAEYNSINWEQLKAGDPEFFKDFYRRITFKEGELSHLGDGAFQISERWNLGEDYWTYKGNKLWTKMGYPVHHSNESDGQVGAVISVLFNRDAQCHTHQNFIGSGLPTDLQKEIAAEMWGGPEAIDAPADYKPMTRAKAKFAKWSVVRNLLHDSLTVCNWMWPFITSPLKDRNYRGNTALESLYYTEATGETITEDELDLQAERLFTLHRALTVKQMGTVDMRNKHDQLTGWQFDMDPDKKAFTPGTIKLDRDDFETTLTMFYEEMGWDAKTGSPTRATLDKLGLGYVADELEVLKLLPV
ncbi:MAG: aldehyde ferredoxin oxidoreductase [Spirochaetales bacterium]|nr:aldehyde ferredoxin oxidoreductase [Spirochaetales bacterium]